LADPTKFLSGQVGQDGWVYVNDDYRPEDLAEIHALIERWPFAVLIVTEPELALAFVPIELRRDVGPLGTLVGHVAAVDPIAASLRAGERLRVAFLGPVTYVSPTLYADRGLPTYNFGAVEVEGRARPFDDEQAVRRHLMTLVSTHEAHTPEQQATWRPDEWARNRIGELLDELQAFELPIDWLDAKVKMGQNRTPGDRLGTIAGLEAAGGEHACEAARMMRARYDDNGDFRPRD